ncbi:MULTISPECIES: TetR/AcrR family transcriptional regulator [unclassified Rhodococcus (in: high G+C Gram-positive bacteria)]|uniref:TetR/AcrR family transcriptional regulator n=1 Tax=unclassified Rhodococcus (in: high G+C Gram-positive bacteria) TaxID=192944 RepID=UPI00163AB689|nr:MULTISPECIES: TetR/AcrR family transcriptional regulator [unclassified Rhodococcus (in: high G+C Gram-positive bacteria)]MBC2644234.1 TetR/AcrR family transcriptional regulator [Rhodococcus sp. 3A]MBC2891027.1 TetR/AcrR family transcriptional regulator [Rhodococcus sp. 4CII]
MQDKSAVSVSESVPERLIRATIGLLAEQGPAAIKARTVATATGLSTMVVYSHFGGIPELIRAVVEHGFTELGDAFSRVPVTEDPIADLFTLALTCRRIARKSPHLYDLMFGLSTRATYRPLESDMRLSGQSPAFRDAYARITDACARLVNSGRVRQQEPEVVAAQLWSFVHGYITLELGEHFADFNDAVTQVLLPMGVNFAVGLGDTRKRAQSSHDRVVRLYAAGALEGARSAGARY